jgi:thymidylate kinase
MKKELNLNWIKMINKFAIEPDIVIFLDITPEIGQNRLANGQIRVKDHTYFNDIIQQEKIRSEYYQILNLEKKDLWDFTDNKNRGNEVEISKICNTTVFRINGTLTEDRIEKIIRDNVKKLLKEKGIEKLDKNSNLENKSLPQFTGT